ncbi:hypothetical protein ABEX78_04725 [Priestia megaterium]
MIGGKGKDSCGESGLDETPEGAESEVLHGNQQLCNKRFSSFIPFVRL